MYIKQWLQETRQKLQCRLIIDETIWELSQQGIRIPKIIEKEVESTQINALGQSMRCYERLYEGAGDFYQQLLDYKFDVELEVRLERARLLAVARGVLVQNSIQYEQNSRQDGYFIVHGTDNEAVYTVFGILKGLVREKYATTISD